MLTGIDHIVVIMSDLEAAIKSYEQLGFTVVSGGRHPGGTHNALISLADGSYIELIAFYQPNSEHQWWNKLERGGGLIDFCLRTDDLLSEIAAFRQAGIDMSDQTPGGRVRPDDYKIIWRTSMPNGRYRGVFPFLIEDETPREERVPKETKHQNGVSGIDTITIVVDELPTITRWYGSILRDDGQEIKRDDLDAAGVRFTIRKPGGVHGFDFVVPKNSGSPLSNWLRDRGPSPYAVTFRTALGGKMKLLNETNTLGPRLTQV
ncbi:MAG: VOC family protein [Pyrinomonadaceae bacterium]